MKREAVSLFIVIMGLSIFLGMGIFTYGMFGVKSIIAYIVAPNTDAILVFCAGLGLLLITGACLLIGSVVIWSGIEYYKGKI